MRSNDVRLWRAPLSVILSLGLITGFLVAASAPAEATFPGANGKIAFSQKPSAQPEDPGEIVAINANGSGEVNLTNSAEDDIHPAWSANGERMAFVRAHQCAPGPSVCGLSELYVMNADGSAQVRLTNNDWQDFLPGFSLSGSVLIFASDRANICQPANNTGNADLYSTTVSPNAASTRLTNTPQHESAPEFSPDGGMITYTRSTGCFTSTDREIFVMNSDGNGQTRLTAGLNPSWSPDGSRIAFSNPSGGVSVINRDGTNEEVLSTSGRDPAWAPDGTKIAFVSNRDDGDEIYVMNADGSNETRITTTLLPKRFPDWQPLSGGGQPDGCIVPAVKGKRLAAAKSAITQANCSVGKVTKRFSNKVKKGRAIKTQPAADSTLAASSPVDLVMSKGKRS